MLLYSGSMDELDEALALLGVEGIDWPGPAYWVGIVLFGVLGIVLFIVAGKRKKRMVKWVAIALMLYPYVVWGTISVWIVGILLCGLAAWCWRRPG
ncbi:MAG: hypothetical protein ABI645_13830 [Pseudomonadota bacterium]